MQRFNANMFYRLAAAVHPLTELEPTEGQKLRDIFVPLFQARSELVSFTRAAAAVSLERCVPAAQAILEALDNAVGGKPTREALDEPIRPWAFWGVVEKVKAFETVLANELAFLDLYVVLPKGIFSTTALIERAEEGLVSVKSTVNATAVADMRQAGKCIAFELPTAAGFHLLRAVEAALVDYTQALAGRLPDARNWGAYIDLLKKHKAAPEVVAVLDQIRALHRNPTIHPGEVLSMDETVMLLGIAQSAIVALETARAKHQGQGSLPLGPAPEVGDGGQPADAPGVG